MQDATDIRELTLVELGEVQGGNILLVAGGPIVGILVQCAIDGFVETASGLLNPVICGRS